MNDIQDIFDYTLQSLQNANDFVKEHDPFPYFGLPVANAETTKVNDFYRVSVSDSGRVTHEIDISANDKPDFSHTERSSGRDYDTGSYGGSSYGSASHDDSETCSSASCRAAKVTGTALITAAVKTAIKKALAAYPGYLAADAVIDKLYSNLYSYQDEVNTAYNEYVSADKDSEAFAEAHQGNEGNPAIKKYKSGVYIAKFTMAKINIPSGPNLNTDRPHADHFEAELEGRTDKEDLYSDKYKILWDQNIMISSVIREDIPGTGFFAKYYSGGRLAICRVDGSYVGGLCA